MKRRDVIRALEVAGLELREGGKHTLVYKAGVRISAVPRHREIREATLRQIAKQTGVKLD